MICHQTSSVLGEAGGLKTDLMWDGGVGGGGGREGGGGGGGGGGSSRGK